MDLQFLHIPKCAGTSIENWGRTHGYRWGRFFTKGKGLQLKAPNEGRWKCVLFHVPPQFFEHDPYENYELFTVTRCPIERAISEFRCPWHGFCAPAKTEGAKRRRREATKDELNSWLLKKTKPLLEGRVGKNAHLLPQHWYLDRVKPENILRFEHLDKDWAAFWDRRGLKVEPLNYDNQSEMPRFNKEDLKPETIERLHKVYTPT
jgi:hypothetical protein